MMQFCIKHMFAQSLFCGVSNGRLNYRLRQHFFAKGPQLATFR